MTLFVRLRFKLLLLSLLAVVVYLPGVEAGYFVFDDSDIVFGLQNRQFALRDLFSGNTGTYFRPLTIASYLLDSSLWGLAPPMMHLENILLHVLNSFLVYACTRRLLQREDSDLPLLIAALFALHPINTEAVNWISGRTDLLAAVFCLTAVYFVVLWQDNTSRIANCYVAATFVFFGSLAKEVAFGMFIGGVLFCLTSPLDAGRKTDFQLRLQAIFPFLFFSILYLRLRALVFSTNDHGLESVVGKTLDTSLLAQIESTLTAMGFYVKKLLIPTPLTFAIDNISSHYLWLGIATLVATLTLIPFRSRPAGLVYMTLACIAPALINATHQVAWTPLAERYMYLPAALLCLATGALFRLLHDERRVSHLLLGVLLLYFLPVSVQRNLLWADQVEYLKRAVEQTPNNVMLRNNYGVVLATFGNLAEARRQFDIAGSLDPGNELVRINRKKYRPSSSHSGYIQ